MKKLRAILSIVMVAALICTCFVYVTTANAADTTADESGIDAKLQDKIEDGVILQTLCWSYSEIEKNIPAIAAAGYTTVQTSPVQQPKDMNASTNVSGQWWKLYQPVSLGVAKESWVGTTKELKSLCTTAHKYGVKIVCDVVTNHLGADSENGFQQLAAEVKTYEPTLWNGNGYVKGNPYFHQNLSTCDDSSAQKVTQYISSACPDLNSGNTTVQNKVISLLKECVDCGVDGFRFDAAKHIETPADSGISPNNYWTNIINATNKNAGSKQIFYYGEVLNTAGGGRSISGYTNLNNGKYRVTENTGSNAVRNAVVSGNASSAANLSYSLTGGATHAVVWAESHDTYLNTEAGNTTNISDENILKTWALVASRKDATPLFFARTNGMKMGGSSTNTSYKSVAAAEVNKFHNNFVGQSEKSGASGNFAYVARGGKGIVIVNVKGTSASASVSGTGLADGTYKDMITGAEFKVSGGTVSGKIGSTGIAVVVQGDTTPTAWADQESKQFSSETITVGLSLNNATSGTYQLEDYTPVKFTGSPKIKIGSDYKYGDTINLTLTATDGKQTTTTKYEYKKVKIETSGVYIIVPKSVVDTAGWTPTLYCYIYDTDSGNGKKQGGKTYSNGAWPGEEMEFDPAINAYYYEVKKYCIEATTTKVDNSGNVLASSDPTASTFVLANSTKAHIIVSDSAKKNLVTGRSEGNQYPGSSTKKTLDLLAKSHEFTTLKSPNAPTWKDTTLVPGQQGEVSATDVTKGNIATEKPTETETQTQTQTATATDPVPSGKLYGDANNDSKINVKDATAIQKHAADLEKLTGDGLILADVDGSKSVNIKDATYIQKYCAALDGTANVGKKYGG